MTEDEDERKGGVGAKSISKTFKVVCGGGMILCSLLKWLGYMPLATIGEICMAWAAVYGIGAGTIDMNIMLDKLTGRRDG